MNFSIDRNLAEPLAKQVADGMRKAISAGTYSVGDVLPSYNSLAAELGVSQRVTREAFGILASEGLVVARPRSGCRVASGGVRRGRMLAVFHDCHRLSVYAMAMLSEIERLAVKAGYAFESVFVPVERNGVCDTAPLEDALRSPFSVAFSFMVTGKVERFMAGSGVPYVAIGASCWIPGAAMTMSSLSQEADSKCVERCVGLGVKTALVAGYGKSGARCGLVKMFKSCGVAVEWRQIPLRFGFGFLQAVETAGYECALERFSGKRPLPDVAVVLDDYYLRGFLLGLERQRVRVPDDLRLVGLVNVGFVPPSPVPIACLKVDARKGAKDIFAALRSVMDGSASGRGYYGHMDFEDGPSLGGRGSDRREVGRFVSGEQASEIAICFFKNHN